MLRAFAREFADGEIAPRASEMEETGELPPALRKALRENNFFSLLIPEEFGGSAVGYVSYTLILEELARASAAVAITVSVHNSVTAGPIQSVGNDAQRARWLPLLAQTLRGAFALTGDHEGDYKPWHPTPGTYRISVLPYRDVDGREPDGPATVLVLTIAP